MKLKKVLSLVIASTLLFSKNIYANSNKITENNYQENIYYDDGLKITENSIKDPNLLNEIIINDNVEIPEGYKLVEVITTTVEISPDISNNIDNSDIEQENSPSLFDKWTLKNKTSEEVQGKLITSDWFDGPSSFTHSYEETVSASFSTNAGISAKALSAELGFSVTASTKLTKTYNVNIAKGKKVNLKVYVNNKKYSYSVYKGDKYKGTGTATEPIGLVFKQYVYNK